MVALRESTEASGAETGSVEGGRCNSSNYGDPTASEMTRSSGACCPSSASGGGSHLEGTLPLLPGGIIIFSATKKKRKKPQGPRIHDKTAWEGVFWEGVFFPN